MRWIDYAILMRDGRGMPRLGAILGVSTICWLPIIAAALWFAH